MVTFFIGKYIVDSSISWWKDINKREHGTWEKHFFSLPIVGVLLC